MSDEKTSLNQLKSLSLSQLEDYKSKALERKAQLEALKSQGAKAWTDSMQEELDELVLTLVDMDEAIDEKMLDTPNEPSYKVPRGEEKMVHVELLYGSRFNPNTGKLITKPYLQKFTYPEWQLFKKTGLRIGYKIAKVLHDPFGDAKALLFKPE